MTFQASGTQNSVASRAFISLSAPGAVRFKVYIDGTFFDEYPAGNNSIVGAQFFPDTRIDVISENQLFGVSSFRQQFRLVPRCIGSGRCTYTVE
ncbi:hypothetical protein EYS14_22505 [Alteromonadaceae bacterium M269]|nr:hypothetical protein EYS14_22505 [Alteromonadaceae bacterium M269]